MPRKTRGEEVGAREDQGAPFVSFTASLITQGKHRLYTLSMPREILVATCVVDTRDENPLTGFQRVLDERRARDIADYIDTGLGTIPSSIVLSAQAEAELQYIRKTRTIRFRETQRAFLILDGQHRVFGFHLAKAPLRVPVVIYNSLSRAEECRLFIDINTKQRPVPNELLLDIKRLAETETDTEALLRDVFDAFATKPDSPLVGLLSPAARTRGKISRVTFNAAMRGLLSTIIDSSPETAYEALAAYLHACLSGLRIHGAEKNLTNPTLFKALMLLFPTVAERVADRHGREFTAPHFQELLAPFFRRLRRTELQRLGTSHVALYDSFRKALQSGFSLTGAA